MSGAADQNSPGTVSVIIPTRNRADSCVRAIESALAQTLPPLEVIVCDDFSTDDTEATISAMSAADERIRYFRRTDGPRGPGATRNHAVQEARGEFVAFLDDDDEWLAEKLQRQIPAVITSPGLICSNACRTSGGLYFDDETDHPIARREILEHNPIILSTVIIGRPLLLDAGGFTSSTRLGGIADYELWLRLSDRGVRMVRIGEPLALYADSDGGRMSSREARMSLGLFEVLLVRALRSPTDFLLARKAFSTLVIAVKQSLSRPRADRAGNGTSRTDRD